MVTKQTKARCMVCKGIIVEKFVSEVPRKGFIGRQESYDESCGFHCEYCGLKYEFLKK